MQDHEPDSHEGGAVDAAVRAVLLADHETAARVARRALAVSSPRPRRRLVLAAALATVVAVAALLVVTLRQRPATPRPSAQARITATGSLVATVGPDGTIRVRSAGGTRTSRGAVLVVAKGGRS